MDYNQNTPPPRGGVIHKKAGEPFETDLSDARHDLFRLLHISSKPHCLGEDKQEVHEMKQTFNVTGMTCSACSAHVEKAVNKLEAVSKAEVSLMTNSMSVEYNSDALSPQDIIYAVEQAG